MNRITVIIRGHSDDITLKSRENIIESYIGQTKSTNIYVSFTSKEKFYASSAFYLDSCVTGAGFLITTIPGNVSFVVQAESSGTTAVKSAGKLQDSLIIGETVNGSALYKTAYVDGAIEVSPGLTSLSKQICINLEGDGIVTDSDVGNVVTNGSLGHTDVQIYVGGDVLGYNSSKYISADGSMELYSNLRVEETKKNFYADGSFILDTELLGVEKYIPRRLSDMDDFELSEFDDSALGVVDYIKILD